MHEVTDFFLILFLILVGARIFGELFASLSLPSVLGEIIVGILLGPSLLGWVEVNDALKILAEIGILLLLFEVGLDTDIKKLKSTGNKSLLLAILGAIIPFVSAYIVSFYIFELNQGVSLFISGTLTATSIGITMRILRDIGASSKGVTQIIMGAAVLDDIFGVLLIIFIYDFITLGEVSFLHTAEVGFYVVIFFIIAPFLASATSKVMEVMSPRHKVHGFIPTIMISLILLFSYIASLLNIPQIIGSFAVGLAFSRRFMIPLAIHLKANSNYIENVKNSMHPIIYLFSPIFFVYVGLSMDLSSIDFTSLYFYVLSISLVIVAILGKFIPALFLKQPFYRTIMIGISMVPRGEVGLIFAELGRSLGVFDNTIFSSLVIVIIITTLLPALLLPYVNKKESNCDTISP